MFRQSSSSSENPDQFFDNLTIYILAILSIFGLIGNILNVIVFANIHLFRRSPSVFYLMIESITNIGQNLSVFTVYSLLLAYDVNPESNILVWCKLKNLFVPSFGLISILIMCFAACDQFFSTSTLYYLRRQSTLELAYRLTIIAICCAIIFGIPMLIYFEIVPLIGCIITNPTYLFYYSFIHFPVLFGLLPIFLSSLLSFLAYRNVRYIVRQHIGIVRRKLDQQLTAMVLMRIIFFVLLTLPYLIFNIYMLNITYSKINPVISTTVKIIGLTCQALAIINTAGSFYLFVISSTRYRRQVKFILVKKVWKGIRRKFCSRQHQVTPVHPTTTMRVYSAELETVSDGT